MLVWLTRIVAGLSGFIALMMVVTAFSTRRWPYGVMAATFIVWVVGWILLGNHWRDVNGGTRVVLDGRTALIAGTMVAAVVAGAFSMSTLD